MKCKLRILKGLNAGAEITLDEGKYIVGSDPETDLILEEEDLQPKHLEISWIENKISFLPLSNGKTFIDGVKLTKQTEFQLENFIYLKIGKTLLVCGSTDASWKSDHDFLEKYTDPDRENQEPQKQKEPTNESPARGSTWLSRGLKKQPVLITLGMTGFLAAVSGISAFIVKEPLSEIFHLGNASEKSESTEPSIADALAHWTRKYPITVRIAAGITHIEGYVPSVSERHILEKEIRSLAPLASTRIWAEQDVQSDIQEYIARRDLPLNVEYMGEGEIRIVGFFPDNSKWERFEQQLRGDISGIQKISQELLYTDDVISILETSLAKHEINNDLVIRRVKTDHTSSTYNKMIDMKIVLVGSIALSSLERWETFRNEVESILDSRIPVQANVEVETDQNFLERIGLTEIRNINTSNQDDSYITTAEGIKYYTGSSFNDGYTLVGISDDTLMFRRGKSNFPVKYRSTNQEPVKFKETPTPPIQQAPQARPKSSPQEPELRRSDPQIDIKTAAIGP